MRPLETIDAVAAALTNDTDYGLVAGFWTTDLQRALSLPQAAARGNGLGQRLPHG